MNCLISDFKAGVQTCNYERGRDRSLTTMQNWRELYRIAIFENDRDKWAFRIHQAEEALNVRRRELFTQPRNNDVQERNAIDDALHRLRALSYCARLDSPRAL